LSRYVNDIATSKSDEEVERVSLEYLAREGFEKTTYGHETAWKKGHGLLAGPQYVKTAAADGRVHIEAWIKFALLPGVYVGETGTEGKAAAIPKRKLRQRVEEIEKLVS
jgi:hypothetical protein